MVQLIALDMDGTVLSPDHTISARNKRAIQAAQNKGIEVMIATGRGYLDAIIPIKELDISLPFICLNGSEVRDEQGKIVATTYLLQQDLQQIVTEFETGSLAYDIFIGDYLYTRNIEDHIQMYIHFSDKPRSETEQVIRHEMQKRIDRGLIREIQSYDSLLETYEESVYKVLAMSTDDQKLESARDRLAKLETISISSSGNGNIEINNRHAQKGIAIERYAAKKGISMDNVMVIGDNFNDISMMKRAGIAVAMENAPNEVKAFCTKTTASNEHDGVALAIEEVL